MRLADFITANTKPILQEWEAFARQIWPGRAETDPAVLRDHAAKMLLATVADMKSSQTGLEQSDKSKGLGKHDSSAGGVDHVSAAHGVDRVGSGFDLATVIAEYRALRASVLRLWRESKPQPDLIHIDDITRFNESIDQSLAEAVISFTKHVDHERAVALREIQKRSEELQELNGALLVSSVRQHELAQEAAQTAQSLAEAKEEAEVANRTKDKFLAMLSHELRTPLSPVLMTISSIEIDPNLPFHFRDDLATVRRNIELEVKLIDDLVDLSRVSNGKLRLHLQSVDVHDVLHHVLKSSMSDVHGKRLTLKEDLSAANDRVSADPARLQQVFWNLLRNAVKFTPEGGEIAVSTWIDAENKGLCVGVRDTGVGIRADVLPRIFDAFEQGETQVTRKFGGLGLGLAISKAVVEMHGGTITASSAGRDQGASFTVNLAPPLLRSIARPTTTAPADNAEQSRANLRLMLVEDHPDTARILARLLRQSGYQVKVAGTVAAALRLAATEPFDLVVSDIGLPDATGYELMKEIRDRYGTKGIALTGYGMEDDVRKSHDAGFAEHVVKPVDLAQLESAIWRLLTGPEFQPTK